MKAKTPRLTKKRRAQQCLQKKYQPLTLFTTYDVVCPICDQFTGQTARKPQKDWQFFEQDQAICKQCNLLIFCKITETTRNME